MNFQSSHGLETREFADYNFAHVRDLAFDAMQNLWRRRLSEGWQQKQIAEAIGRDRGWVSKNLRGPGNWTLRTIAELVGGMQGEIEISVHAAEDLDKRQSNYDAYLGYSEYPKLQQPVTRNSVCSVVTLDTFYKNKVLENV